MLYGILNAQPDTSLTSFGFKTLSLPEKPCGAPLSKANSPFIPSMHSSVIQPVRHLTQRWMCSLQVLAAGGRPQHCLQEAHHSGPQVLFNQLPDRDTPDGHEWSPRTHQHLQRRHFPIFLLVNRINRKEGAHPLPKQLLRAPFRRGCLKSRFEHESCSLGQYRWGHKINNTQPQT